MRVNVDGQDFDVPDDATPQEIDSLTAPKPANPTQGYPNPGAKANPQGPPAPSIWQRYLSAIRDTPGHGTAGGVVGGITGGVIGGLSPIPGGTIMGTALGGAAGNALGQRLHVGTERMGPEQQARLAAGKMDLGEAPNMGPEPFRPDSAIADGATQGAFSTGLRVLGGGAARLGFPRVAAALGATTPQAAALAATPEAVKGVSTGALQAVDAASLAGGPAAKEIAAISAEQARRDAVLAMERQLSERTMGPIQQRMAQRVPGLAQKTGEFADQLKKVVPPEKMDKAFSDTPAVWEAARDTPSMVKRSAMIQEAVPQTVDNQALKLARRPLAAAEARGVSGPPTQAAADAAGLRELGGVIPADNSYLTRVVNRVPGVGTAMQILPKGGLSPDRVGQSTAAVLGSRGSPSINPALEKLVTDNPAYRASPSAQSAEAILRQFLSAFGGQKQ